MPRPTRAKYCPRCHAMNLVDAETCIHCGHQFRTGTAAPPPSDDVFNKTQMFMLPPMEQRREVKDTPPHATGPRANLMSFLAALRASPLMPMITLVAIITVALICGAVIAFR